MTCSQAVRQSVTRRQCRVYVVFRCFVTGSFTVRRVVYKGEYKHSSPYAPPSQRLRGRKNTLSRGGDLNFGTRPWSLMVSRVQWRDGRQIFGRAILRDPHRKLSNTLIGVPALPQALLPCSVQQVSAPNWSRRGSRAKQPILLLRNVAEAT